jgi:putative ABC transport system permease protein
MAMSIRERTREVALLKTLGFTRRTVLGLFISEAVILSLAGGLLGALGASLLVIAMAHSPQGGLFLGGLRVSASTMTFALLIAGLVGFVSAFIPSYYASKTNIVDGLRHIG